ncbi:tRNA lysidine(34) synthetase TilS [Thalassovita sp.]|uniref:tRNA lysidine(34) synthetase TilS n=1 Tax=Thalassovita sp. TaxID=1979401 RepID=UPI002B26628E|nr:tRNA lysidine(34) synthetase TilS [Thalassovita sp.]
MTAPDFDTMLRDTLATLPDGPVGIAVSGGGDSMALMVLAADWAKATGRRVFAATVDHGLRPEAAEEARFVAGVAARLGLPHEVLCWTGWDGRGNLQSQARQARYGLLAGWAGRHGLRGVLLAHTSDDQAETLLLRMARGAGVDGLSAMAVRFAQRDTVFLRPLLRARRDDLRGFLRDRGQDWIEDPSNSDTRFDRVKARQSLPTLAEFGLNADRMAQVADNMAEARAALNWAAQRFVSDNVDRVAGDLIVKRDSFLDLPAELARRVVVAALAWLSGADYPPRRAEVGHFLSAIRDGKGATLQGCRMMPRKGGLHLFREYDAIRDMVAVPGAAWDGRWVLTGPDDAGCRVAALGEEGLAQCPDWRAGGRPAAAVMADPAVWRDNDLIAAPVSGLHNGWQATLGPGRDDFAIALYSH